MKKRLAFGFVAVIALLSVSTCAAQEPLVPTVDELSRAPLVLRARAAENLSATEWLFTDVRVLGECPPGAVLPRNILGWWTVKPDWADPRKVSAPPYFPPPPKNDSLLKRGEVFLLLGEENFHLLAVYRSSPDPNACLPGISIGEVDRRVCSARHIRQTVDDFLHALAHGYWVNAADDMTQSLQKQMRSSKSPKEFFGGDKVLRLAEAYCAAVEEVEATARTHWPRDLSWWDMRPPRKFVSLGESSARVRVFGGPPFRVTRAERETSTDTWIIELTKTRPTMFGRGWEEWEIASLPVPER